MFWAILIWSPTNSTQAEEAMDSPEYWKPAQQALGKLADGFVVWESHRTDRWSIWTIKLDGTGLRQLSSDEPTKDQMAPKISPDGKRVIYLSYPKAPPKEDGGPETRGEKVPLHIINADGTGDRILVEDARVYEGWDRAVTWFNDNELAYIAANKNTYQLNLTTGESTLLIKHTSTDSHAWLPNSRKNFAAWSFNAFSSYDSKRQLVRPFPHMGGCQPYFTQDGEWGFWESYLGGPIGVVHLDSWILAGDRTLMTPTLDRSMMPMKHRDYIYFPMYSSDNRLLAVGVKDHDAPGGYGMADWDIFVVQTDPKTLAVIGKPIRYSFEPECDRFPDVWQAPLPLGFQSVEAPFTAQFEAPAGDGWTWDYGDGAADKAAKGPHLYSEPGLYAVTATLGKKVLYGQILVKKAQSPRARRAILREGGEVAVIFDEPVDLKNVKVDLKSQAKIEKTVPGDDGRTLRILLAHPPETSDILIIDGVTDLAQRPNKMAPAELPFDVRTWPASRDGMVFLWHGSNKRNILRDPENGDTSSSIAAKGRAWYNHDRDMVVDGPGMFVVPGLSEVFTKVIKKSKAFTIELSLAHSQGSDEPRCILSYGILEKNNNYFLQHNDHEIKVGRGGYLAVTYNDGRLITYEGVNLSIAGGANGQYSVRSVANTDKFPLDLGAFAAEPLFVGNNSKAQKWPLQDRSGLIVKSMAFYDRALSSKELAASYTARVAIDTGRPPVETFDTWGQMVAASKTPQNKEIAPYTRALAVNEYEGPTSADNQKRYRIRVAHWVLFDRQYERIAQIPVKGDLQMRSLEPFDINEQLQGEYISDTLPDDPDVPVYFCSAIQRVTRGGTFLWNVVGPFALDDPEKIDTGTEAEKNLTNTDKTYKPTEGRQWKSIELPRHSDGYVDLRKMFPEAKWNCAYGHFYIKSPDDRKAVVSVETAGGAKLWLNGKSALSYRSDRFPSLGQKREPVELRAGWNEILIKVTSAGPAWGFVCDILSVNGREMLDIQFTTDLDIPGKGVW